MVLRVILVNNTATYRLVQLHLSQCSQASLATDGFQFLNLVIRQEISLLSLRQNNSGRSGLNRLFAHLAQM